MIYLTSFLGFFTLLVLVTRILFLNIGDLHFSKDKYGEKNNFNISFENKRFSTVPFLSSVKQKKTVSR